MPIFDATKIETGDVFINKMDLVKLDGGTYSIYAQFETCSIFEDIFQPVIYAEFTLFDSLSILKSFPIIGKEYINLDFNTPGISNHISLKLFVYAVTDVSVDVSSNSVRYHIKCCSEEFFWNNQTTMDKYYYTTINAMVQDALQNYLRSTKTLNIDATQGVQHIVPARISPLEFIDIVKSRAKSPSNQSSSYVFFENSRGFNFTTIEALFSKTANIKTYYKHTALRTGFENEWTHWDINDYIMGQEFNVLDNIKVGSYQGTFETYDLHTKTFYTNQYTAQNFKQFKTLDTQAVIHSVAPSPSLLAFGIPVVGFSDNVRSIPQINATRYGNDTGTRYLNIADSYRPPTYIEEFISKKLAFMATNLTSSIDIYVPGDSSSAVGDIFNIQMLKADKLTDKPPTTPDYLTNGNYFSHKIRHNLLNSERKPKYSQVISLAKGTFINPNTDKMV